MRTRTRIAASLAALALILPAGCGATRLEPSAAEATAPAARDLAGYDAYVLASAENNPLFADVYAIRFEPFAIDRVTTGKRVSSLGADEQYVMVAAADEDVDRLAQVTAAGGLAPVPGLGRPFAYAPTIVDGVMYYDDAQGSKARGENRYFAWDLKTRTKKLLFQTNEELGGAAPIGNGRLVLGKPGENGEDETIIRSRSGEITRFPLDADASNGAVSMDWIAVTVIGAGDRFGDKPEALLLIDPSTGKKKRVPGLQVVCWSPDGSRLLARRTDSLAESRLVLLDPAKPDALTDVGTVPGLVIYSGTWVRGNPPS